MKKAQAETSDALTDSIYSRNSSVFLTVVQCKSFSAAAERLGISQPSVSLSIKYFEEKLGFDLFERATRPLKLTEEGRVLYEIIKNQHRETDEVLSQIRNKNFIKPSLRIGLIESISDVVSVSLIKALKPFTSSVRIRIATSEDLLRDLVRNELDVAIVSSTTNQDQGLNSDYLFKCPLVIVVPQAVKLPENFTWKNLSYLGLPYIYYSKRTADGLMIEQSLESLSLKLPTVLEVESNRLLCELAAANLGWGFVQPLSLLRFADIRKIKILEAPYPLTERKIHLISQQNIPRSLSAVIADIVKKQVRERFHKELLPLAPWISKYLD